MKKIIVVGSSFGGLTAAFRLRKQLSKEQAEIRVLSKNSRFTFIPALPWVAMGELALDAVSFDVGPALAKRGIDFSQETLLKLHPDRKVLVTEKGEQSYDYLVLATGHRSAHEAVPGLDPAGGAAHSLMSPAEAEETARSLSAFLAAPGPVVVGCAPGASCIGPAYEFALELDHKLRGLGLRHQVPMTFLTPEPFLGHFGMGGMGGRQFLEAEFEKRDIRYVCNAAISAVSSKAVELADGQRFDSSYTMVIPALAGVEAVASTPGLANPKGFIPVDEHYRHKSFPGVFAVGVAVAMLPAGPTAVPVNFPKTGHMTEQMATLAATNIAAEILGKAPVTQELAAACLMDLGDRAVYLFANPVHPPRNTAQFSEGRWWLPAKKLFARYYIWSMKRGMIPRTQWVW